MSAKCSARIAEFEDLQYFRDGKHRFYFETRCNRVCHDNMNVCLDCSRKNPESRTQYSRTFNHGLVTEPIPDKSDIYGGKRYVDNAKKWGPPGGDVLREAERKRALSNGTNVVTMNTNAVTMNTNAVTMNTNVIAAAEYKVIVPISEETAAVNPHTVIMPKKAKEPTIALDATTLEQSAIAVEQVEKKVRKRPQASEATKAAVILALAKKAAEELEVVEVVKKVEERVEEQEQKVSVVKVVEKVAAIKVSEVVEKKVEKIEPKEKEPKEKEPKEKEPKEKEPKEKEPKEKEKEKKPRAPRKKKIETPYTALSKAAAAKNPLGAINKQEVCIPTHIEKTLETVDTDGYEIEYVRLTKFEHNGIKYFRDMKKQKLYERVKDTSVGKYVGRYDSYSDSIIEDVPDSDSE
jgi:hypothetical protein